MEKIFVIGSNSFSGASFVDFALQNGGQVIGTSRSLEPIDALLPYKWRDHQNFDFHQLDLNNDLNEIGELLHSVKPSYVMIDFAAACTTFQPSCSH